MQQDEKYRNHLEKDSRGKGQTMNLELQEKTAIITGGADGIGYASAEMLAAEGAHVVLADINFEKAQQAADTLNDAGYSALALYVDVQDGDSVKEMVSETVSVFGRIDILVNNAGIGYFKTLEEETPEDWQRALNINLTGAQFCSRYVFDQMKKQKSGRIIMIGSLGGQIGGLKVTPGYVASKAGIMGLTKSYARNGAAYGIRANSIAPGPTETEMGKQGNYSPEMTLVGRLGRPADVAKVVLFLSSSLADYLTGITVDVNGGALLR